MQAMGPKADIVLCVDKTRKIINGNTSRTSRSEIGQFFTPATIARFMASLFEKQCKNVRILDAGAGAGVLFAALVQRLCSNPELPKSIEVVAYESDSKILRHLQKTMELCRAACSDVGIRFDGVALCEDFISGALAEIEDGLFGNRGERFTHAILNPPYKKINGETSCRKLLNAAGLETTNLYAAFVWLSARLLNAGGELVAITPRSFCNGPYFKRFRKSLLELIGLRHIHLFRSRKEAFADDSVLQENIIFYGVRGQSQSSQVRISVSKGQDFGHSTIRVVPFQKVVRPNDADAFIHLIEDDHGKQIIELMTRFKTTLTELGLEVSTGRVVDFRSREYLREKPEPGTAPLVYPCHFHHGLIRWPLPKGKKPNAIVSSCFTQNFLVKAGYYVVTKRFSSKEERRRVVAAIYDPNRIEAPLIGFENHLNYFHKKGEGISEELARGLAIFLNSTIFDRYFRLFSGHTQVNATDLRKMRYPSLNQMLRLGKTSIEAMPDQDTIDEILEKVCGQDG